MHLAFSLGARDQTIASLFVRKSSEKDASRAFDQNRDANPDAVAIDGIDARAYYVPSMGQMNVLDDDAWFIITANKDGLSGEPQVTEEHRQLAALVVNGTEPQRNSPAGETGRGAARLMKRVRPAR